MQNELARIAQRMYLKNRHVLLFLALFATSHTMPPRNDMFSPSTPPPAQSSIVKSDQIEPKPKQTAAKRSPRAHKKRYSKFKKRKPAACTSVRAEVAQFKTNFKNTLNTIRVTNTVSSFMTTLDARSEITDTL